MSHTHVSHAKTVNAIDRYLSYQVVGRIQTTSGPSCCRSLDPASKLDTEEEIARLEALLAAATVIDRQAFFGRVNLSNRAARNQTNALLKRLGIKVAITKAGSRSKLAHYAVYQNELLIMKLKDETRKIESEPFSPEMAMRLHHQGELREALI